EELRHHRVPHPRGGGLALRAARPREPCNRDARVDPEADLVPVRPRVPEQAPPLRLADRAHLRLRASELRGARPAAARVSAGCALRGAGPGRVQGREARGAGDRLPGVSRLPRPARSGVEAGDPGADLPRSGPVRNRVGGFAPRGRDVIRRAAMLALLMALVPAGTAATAGAAVPHVNHVFIVVLENENASTTFGKGTKAPYLARTLKKKGAFVPNYYGIAHNSLTNYVAMVSGQSPNIQTQADCQVYNDITPGTRVGSGQVLGTGCIYPPGVEMIGNQLGHAGYQWKGYMEDMNANAPKGQQSPCRHPAIGERDPWQSATPTDEYATRHTPFVYFHSLIDFTRTCRDHDVDYSHLRRDLQHPRTTPSYSLIVPGLCHDGHDE